MSIYNKYEEEEYEDEEYEDYFDSDDEEEERRTARIAEIIEEDKRREEEAEYEIRDDEPEFAPCKCTHHYTLPKTQKKPKPTGLDPRIADEIATRIIYGHRLIIQRLLGELPRQYKSMLVGKPTKEAIEKQWWEDLQKKRDFVNGVSVEEECDIATQPIAK